MNEMNSLIFYRWDLWLYLCCLGSDKLMPPNLNVLPVLDLNLRIWECKRLFPFYSSLMIY